MMDNFVVVATYSSELEAELAKATLTAAGIESVLRYEDTGGMMPVLQHSEGVKLLVDESDVEEAKEMLSTSASEDSAS